MTVAEVARKEGLKRDIIAIAIAVAIHLLVVGAFLLSNLLFFNDVEEYRGPVLVKLGRADAPEEEAESLPASPIESVEEPEVTPEEPVEPVETPEEKESGAPEETVLPQEPESENVVERPVSEEESGDSGEQEQSTVEETGESGVAPVEAPPADVEEAVTVTKGTEEGNAYETTFEATPGLVGRTFGDAIYLYLPVPQFVDASIFDALQDDENFARQTAEWKRGILEQYYEAYGNEYLLKKQTQPPLDQRGQIWKFLAEGGYDMNHPEYKDVSPPLRDLVISFTVELGDNATSLSNVQVMRSSGNSEIDEAVIYGFQRAVFYNSADTPVKGRFTYRFQ